VLRRLRCQLARTAADGLAELLADSQVDVVSVAPS
jgi:hypothetical protein